MAKKVVNKHVVLDLIFTLPQKGNCLVNFLKIWDQPQYHLELNLFLKNYYTRRCNNYQVLRPGQVISKMIPI